MPSDGLDRAVNPRKLETASPRMKIFDGLDRRQRLLPPDC